MSNSKTILSSETLVPIGVISLAFGAAAWLTVVYAQGQENMRQIIEIKELRKDDMEYIREELKHISDKLDKMK